MADTEAYFSGKRVLVTGAGGSIGSELCRQISAFGIEEICLLDHSEFRIYQVDRDMGKNHPSVTRRTVICDVRDLSLMDRCFLRFRPDIVFHAAALKHVPLMESNVCEAVLTNIKGTRNVLDLCEKYGVDRSIFVSTDKAVDPTSVMGATKFVAEEIVQQRSLQGHPCSNVRFGNVVGSAGSVIPLFESQIAHGGPLTVTDPELKRFLMTIPEAVYLLLRVATLPPSKEISTFVLEMGEPVRIADIARKMIDMHMSAGGAPIDIQFIGITKGEKLVERLNWDDEHLSSLENGIYIARGTLREALSNDVISDLITRAASGDDDMTRDLIFELSTLRAQSCPAGADYPA